MGNHDKEKHFHGRDEHNDHEHDHGHKHNHHGHSHSHAPDNKAGLTIALVITSVIMLLEFFGGLVTNSLALLSDSGHMLSDVGALALSLVAMGLASRPPSPHKSYGYYRFEILAALFNGVTLFIISAFIIREAYERFIEPPTVASGSMMIIAAIGLLANIISAWFLMKKSDVKDNINVRSAYLHVIGDALGSVGAIIAGLLMLVFEWYIADPIISVVVSLLILKSAWGIMKSAVHILMEGTPPTIDSGRVEESLLQIDGVMEVHDLHIWTVSSGLDSLTCHIVIEDDADSQIILQQAIQQIEQKFRILHATIQVEKSNLNHSRGKV
ncbi:cation diffusion facilitator family transporter [Paenibacillus mendelii]|uniref:Cation diffusion facilitator family transporter n=1 Tax=Paenibacillus mendelii TaxID=206163 RepID=A0ABV6JIJ3_9BACL|nr:cation diffusion facilitator family transporter [Paenibacillus mendelii]MCQ6558411.1 cation diffusion facilitator family transporter [Paenibacillus mendelii]